MHEARPRLEGKRVLLAGRDSFYSQMKTRLERAGACVVGPVSDPRATVGLVETSAVDAALLDEAIGGNVYPIAHILAGRRIPFAFAGVRNPDRLPPAFRGARRAGSADPAGVVSTMVGAG